MRLLTLLFASGALLTGCADDSKESTPSSVLPDADGDGYYDDADCAPDDAAISPGADELCNSIDDDCDGDTDEAGAVDGTTYFADSDGDSFGDADNSTTACAMPAGYLADSTDCDDGDAAINPGAAEICDDSDTDENCDGAADDATATGTTTFYADGDDDGYGAGATMDACDAPEGYADSNTDCDDADAAVNPGAAELCDDADLDEDCDGLSDDADDSVTGTTYYMDADLDGYGDTAMSMAACAMPAGYVADNTDCNDADAGISPGAAEVCDDAAADQDCDGLADDGDDSTTGQPTWYGDPDGDGVGDPADTLTQCSQPVGYVDTTTALSLYDQLGGAAGVDAVLDAFLANVAADTSINWMFANTDLANLKTLLAEQICEVAGGGCTYTGGDMVTVHADMAITNDQFNALVADLLLALDTLGVPYTADFSGGLPADSLVLALASMQTDIVTDPDGDVVLFNQLGGYGAVSAVVDGMLANVAADSRINGFFATTDLVALDMHLVNQICEATGGYCTYTGESMCDAHDGMGLTESDFDALVEDLLLSMDSLGVAYTAGTFDGGLPADSLVLALAAMEGEVLGTDCGTVTPTVYDELGGAAGVDAVLEEFLANVGADSNINWMFANSDLGNLKTQLADQICEATGGGCTYTGGDMVTVHADMAITNDQFNSLVGDLLTALDTLAVPYTAGTYDGGLAADTLILTLAAMQPDIVTDADADLVLFNQLGGYGAVQAVVDQFLVNVAADSNINWMFANSDLVHLDEMLVQQICEATGGYCVYTGGDMASVHADMAITNDQFNYLVGDLTLALDQLGVPYTADFSGGLPADSLILALAAMQPDIVTDADADTVLFNQLGGYGAVQAVVDEFLVNVAADTNINWMFADTDLVHLDNMLVEQICEATGGYCVYSGGDMATVHADMAITNDQFNYLVGDLLTALDTLGVPYTAGTYDGGLPADSLILALAGMQPDIVTDPDGTLVNFNQIGGHAALSAVMDEFINVVGADSRINGFFATTDLANLNDLLVEQTCEATGGYCTYSGRSMCDTHEGMGVTEADFDALVEDLLTALDTLGVVYALDGSQPIDTLLFALLDMEGQVLGTDCTF